MKLRKKPVEIEVFQYDGDLKGGDGNYYVPACELFIDTLEGTHHASISDYII